jgi:hypothetical protein
MFVDLLEFTSRRQKEKLLRRILFLSRKAWSHLKSPLLISYLSNRLYI